MFTEASKVGYYIFNYGALEASKFWNSKLKTQMEETMTAICTICKKVHVTDTARLVARAPGITGLKTEWMKLPTIYTDMEICHPCFIKSLKSKGDITHV